MSKRKLYDDDIYVAPYTRKTGKYRHVSGHYRRRSYRKKRHVPRLLISICRKANLTLTLYFWA